MRRLLPIIIIVALGQNVSGQDAGSNSNAAPDSDSIARLIQQLGDSRFRVREAALESLRKLGPEYLPVLQDFAEKTGDAEVRRRLGEIIPDLVRQAALSPTRITLVMEDKPLEDVVKEFSQLTGVQAQLWPKNRKGRPDVSINLQNATFWEGLNAICDLGGLSFQPSYNGYNTMNIQLREQEVHPGIHHLDGPFRVSANSFYHNKNLDFSSRQRNDNEGPFRLNETLTLNLSISVEPKLPLLGAAAAHIAEAENESGQSMLLPKVQDNSNRQMLSYGGYRTFVQTVQARLQPTPGSRKLKYIRGTIPIAVVSAQTPKLVIQDITKVKNKKFREGGSTIEIETAEKNNNQVTVQMEISEVPDPNEQVNHRWMNSVAQRLEVVDSVGHQYRSYGPQASKWRANGVKGRFVFTRQGKTPRAGLNGILRKFFNPKAQPSDSLVLIYYEWTTMNHQVPFEFHDLPLP